MYDVTAGEVCFMIIAYEASNPYGDAGESRSSVTCTPVTENITVPNTFTPDDNLINDYFRPVLSFTPADYHLIVTDMRRRTLFETRDHTEEWDGRYNGTKLPEGVYIWILKVKTPSGSSISKTGTVTIINNR
jgi:gliding motility-associated-like protein